MQRWTLDDTDTLDHLVIVREEHEEVFARLLDSIFLDRNNLNV